MLKALIKLFPFSIYKRSMAILPYPILWGDAFRSGCPAMQALPINLFNRRVKFFNSGLATRRRIGGARSCFVRFSNWIGSPFFLKPGSNKFWRTLSGWLQFFSNQGVETIFETPLITAVD
jgi:hypothetical protein